MYNLTKQHGSEFYRARIEKTGMKTGYNEAKVRETTDYPKEVSKFLSNIQKDIDKTLALVSLESIKNHRDDIESKFYELCSMMDAFDLTILNDDYLDDDSKRQIIEKLSAVENENQNQVGYGFALIDEKIEKIKQERKDRKHQRYVESYEELKRNPKEYQKFLERARMYNDGEGKQWDNHKAKKECVKNAGKCAKCGSEEHLEGHHILPVGTEGSSDTQENLVCLCKSCHQKLHYKLRKKEYTPKEILTITEVFLTY